jgi:hypothetical protein
MEDMLNIIDELQNEIIEQIEELDLKHLCNEIATMEYSPMRDILEAKMELLFELERRTKSKQK